MYWYRSKGFLTLLLAGCIFFISGLSSCKSDVNETKKYFDIKGYFESNAVRLTKLNKPVSKTVMHNGVTESRDLKIADWKGELNLFISSDINRPAWKNSYTVQSDNNVTIYRAKDIDLITREIMITKAGGVVKSIMIYNYEVKNLYDTKDTRHHVVFLETKEKLSWFPDSLYLIQKSQTVMFLGTNKYEIKGFFN